MRYDLNIFFANKLFYYLYRDIIKILLDVSRIHYEFTIYFTISLWIHSLFREYTINSVSFSQAHFQFTIESRIYCEFPNNFAIILNLTIFFANLLSISRKCLEFTICFAITLWIHYRFREFTMNSLLLFGNSLLIYLLYYEFTFNSVDFWGYV